MCGRANFPDVPFSAYAMNPNCTLVIDHPAPQHGTPIIRSMLLAWRPMPTGKKTGGGVCGEGWTGLAPLDAWLLPSIN